MEELRAKKGFICDMDGVIYHGNRLLDGVKEFVDWLYREEKQFLFLTNASHRSPKELKQKLGRMGLENMVCIMHYMKRELLLMTWILSMWWLVRQKDMVTNIF